MRPVLLVGAWLLAALTAAGAGVGLGGCSGSGGGGGEIACGEASCNAAAEYCERSMGASTCRPLPQACGAEPTCDCVLGEPCASSCSNDNGRITLECTSPGAGDGG